MLRRCFLGEVGDHGNHYSTTPLYQKMRRKLVAKFTANLTIVHANSSVEYLLYT
jgi:hypothetical protein